MRNDDVYEDHLFGLPANTAQILNEQRSEDYDTDNICLNVKNADPTSILRLYHGHNKRFVN